MTDDIDIDGYFGKALKVKRKNAHLTQEELALKANFDRTYISLLERGLRKPSLEATVNLAKALHVSPPVLVEAMIEQSEGDPHRKKNAP